MLFPEDLIIDEPNAHWLIAHLKPNQETKMSTDLKNNGIPHFLPLVSKRTARRKLMRPLFPGYIFFLQDEGTRLAVLQTGRTVRIIRVLDQEKLKSELVQVYQALKSGLKIDPFNDIVIGMPCQIVTGAGAGIRGTVIQKSDSLSKQKVVLEISSINQSILLEVDASAIRVISSPQ